MKTQPESDPQVIACARSERTPKQQLEQIWDMIRQIDPIPIDIGEALAENPALPTSLIIPVGGRFLYRFIQNPACAIAILEDPSRIQDLTLGVFVRDDETRFKDDAPEFQKFLEWLETDFDLPEWFFRNLVARLSLPRDRTHDLFNFINHSLHALARNSNFRIHIRNLEEGDQFLLMLGILVFARTEIQRNPSPRKALSQFFGHHIWEKCSRESISVLDPSTIGHLCPGLLAHWPQYLRNRKWAEIWSFPVGSHLDRKCRIAWGLRHYTHREFLDAEMYPYLDGAAFAQTAFYPIDGDFEETVVADRRTVAKNPMLREFCTHLFPINEACRADPWLIRILLEESEWDESFLLFWAKRTATFFQYPILPRTDPGKENPITLQGIACGLVDLLEVWSRYPTHHTMIQDEIRKSRNEIAEFYELECLIRAVMKARGDILVNYEQNKDDDTCTFSIREKQLRKNSRQHVLREVRNFGPIIKFIRTCLDASHLDDLLDAEAWKKALP